MQRLLETDTRKLQDYLIVFIFNFPFCIQAIKCPHFKLNQRNLFKLWFANLEFKTVLLVIGDSPSSFDSLLLLASRQLSQRNLLPCGISKPFSAGAQPFQRK